MTRYKVFDVQFTTDRKDNKIILSIKERKWFKTKWSTRVFWGTGTVWREFENGTFTRCNSFIEELLSDVEYQYRHFKKDE